VSNTLLGQLLKGEGWAGGAARESAAHPARRRARRGCLHATPECWEGVAKSHFLLKAVVVKSQNACQDTLLRNLPPPTLWRGEAIHANRFISQLLEHCPGNTPKVDNWSRYNPRSGLLTNTFGVFASIIQQLTCESVRMDTLVWSRPPSTTNTIFYTRFLPRRHTPPGGPPALEPSRVSLSTCALVVGGEGR